MRSKAVLALCLLLISVMFIQINGVECAGENWLEGFSHRKQIVVQQTTGAGTNFQVEIDLLWNVGADSGNDIYLNGVSQSDFDDVRFTRANGNTPLDYHISNVVAGIDCISFVEVLADLDAGNSTIYLYYGNSTVSTTSSASNTFIDVLSGCVLAVHFEDGAGTTVKDEMGNDGTIVGGSNYAWVDGYHDGGINWTVGDTWATFPSIAGYNVTTEYTVLSWVYHYNTLVYPMQRNDATHGLWYEVLSAGGLQSWHWVGGAQYGIGYYVNFSTQWAHIGTTYESGVLFNMVHNGSQVGSTRNHAGAVDWVDMSLASGAGGISIIDDLLYFDVKLSISEIASIYNNHGDGRLESGSVCVRKWLDTQPAIVVGSEESSFYEQDDLELSVFMAFIAVVIALTAFLLIVLRKRR